ncbi:hypothetical protein ACFYWY_14195 [Streptomyces sp. NPDC002870]|uniref:hypothetical protein n=1 Tax=Streptomyces sp. NPDC002870 TaxID=3364666 RepID=UPI003680F2D3
MPHCAGGSPRPRTRSRRSAHISPYLTEHIRRFGEYSTHELGLEPEAYDPHLDVDFSPLRGDGPGADGYRQAA